MEKIAEQILGIIYTIAFITCYWPQIIKTYKTKRVEDVSLSLFTLSIIGYLAAIGYTILRVGYDFWWLLNYGVSFVGALTIVVLYFKYK
tara:strand:+ start:937 stop:1203 length:267 start_codon:yes stop_codon:yes gene_type:complete